jgi:hypothetical protein
MWVTIWNVANSNLIILLLGSGLGFLFVKLVWEPYKQRQEENSRRRAIREEAFYRLWSLECQIPPGARGIGYQIDGTGDYVRSLDPAFRAWSLDGLIFAGWGKDILDECHPQITRLKEVVETGIDDVQGKEKALNAIAGLRNMLQA